MAEKYRVIDGMMGYGKSTWAMKHIVKTGDRFVCVLPRLKEITRYKKGLKELDYEGKVVALHIAENEKEALKAVGKRVTLDPKQLEFDRALDGADVILITHNLFEDYLKPKVFDVLSQGRWHLIMDETITAFEAINGLSKVMLEGFLKHNLVKVIDMHPGVSKIAPVVDVTWRYTSGASSVVNKGEQSILKGLLTRDILMVEDDSKRGFFTFSLSKARLEAFKSVNIMTYLYSDSDLYYWMRMNDMEVEHLKLNSDRVLTPHDGQYGGQKLKEQIEFLESHKDHQYGRKYNHFSATSSKSLTKESVEEVQKDLKRLFQNRRGGKIKPDDFMFTCLAEVKNDWYTKDLPSSFIGESTFVPYNERGTNDYRNVHNVAYLFNVYPNPALPHTVNATPGLSYDEDRLALSHLLQFIWRSAVRNKPDDVEHGGNKIRLFIPSVRMRKLLEDYLNS